MKKVLRYSLILCLLLGAKATLVNEPTYNNHYDPATKTFYISFLWGTFPNNRAATDTLTFNRPRE